MTPSSNRRRALLPLLGAFLLLAPLTLLARADVIRLRTGEAIKGRVIQERTDEKQVTVEDYVSGAYRSFAWDALDPEDRDKIEEEIGIKSVDQGPVTGNRVTIQLDGGDTDEVLGLVESSDDRVVKLRRGGDIVEIPRGKVLTIEEEPLDARQIWSPDQLMTRMKEQLKSEMEQKGLDPGALTSREHWRIAQYAEWAGALEEARDSYAACAADDEYLNKDIAKDRLARIESLLQDQAALETLKDARMKLQMHFFKRVKEILDGFGEKHPDASDAVKEKLEDLKKDLQQERTSYFETVAGRRFVKIVGDLIDDKVREKDVQINDITSWTRQKLPEAAFARLAEREMKRYDEDVTPAEAQTFWQGRRQGRFKAPWSRVSYGAGTFIVNPPKIKPPQRKGNRGGGTHKSSSKSGGAAPAIDIPKPPTRDGWWAASKPNERSNWVLAYFIEHSDLFELGEREFRPCSTCHGEGLLSKTFQTGETVEYLCTRCGGAQQDVIVKYR